MRSFITAVDYGIINTKDAYMHHFPSTFAKETPKDNEDADIISVVYEGEEYYIGSPSQADFNVDINKSLFTDSKVLIYTMLAKYLPEDVDCVKFFTCLPTDQYKANNIIRYKKNIMPNKDYLVSIKVDGESRDFIVSDVEVFPECCSAHYNMPTSKRRLYIDFGGGTVNCALYENGKLVKSKTYSKGMVKLYNDIKNGLHSRYTVEEDLLGIQYIMDNGYYPDKQGAQRLIDRSMDLYAKELHRLISLDFTLAYEVVLTGGGAIRMESQMRKYIKHATLSPTALFDNVLGLLAIARKWWE